MPVWLLHGGVRAADDPGIADGLASLPNGGDPLRSVLVVAVDAANQAGVALLETIYASLGLACTVATISRHAALEAGDFARSLSDFDVVHLAGGSAPHIADVLRGSPLERGLRACGCVAAESGAAMALGAWALGCPDGVDPPSPGLGWLPAHVVDAHFDEPGRAARLEQLLSLNPTLVGIGVNEATALVVEDGDVTRARTVGAGSVRILNGAVGRSQFLSSEFQAIEVPAVS